MKYLPSENITYRTKLDSGEISKRVNEIIEPKKTFRMTGIFGGKNHKPYEGSVNGLSFKITRIIGYRNSFLPNITGEIEKDLNGSKINVKMRLHSFVLLFMFIWLTIVGSVSLTVLISSIDKSTFEPLIVIPLGMFLFGYGMTLGGFKYESSKSKKYLAELFEAEVE
jgi:hypothetical protein